MGDQVWSRIRHLPTPAMLSKGVLLVGFGTIAISLVLAETQHEESLSLRNSDIEIKQNSVQKREAVTGQNKDGRAEKREEKRVQKRQQGKESKKKGQKNEKTNKKKGSEKNIRKNNSRREKGATKRRKKKGR